MFAAIFRHAEYCWNAALTAITSLWRCPYQCRDGMICEDVMHWHPEIEADTPCPHCYTSR
jgi:hypothetical protein